MSVGLRWAVSLGTQKGVFGNQPAPPNRSFTRRDYVLPDLINGAFETIRAVANFANVRALALDKKISGVRVFPTVFFTVWGAWNLFYYPYLHQIYSFAGGLLMVLTNLAWIYLAWKYRRNR